MSMEISGWGASLSASLSETFSHSITVSKSEEKTQEFSTSSIDGEVVVFTVWQLYERFEIVNQDGTTWSDANYAPATAAPPIVNKLEFFVQDVTRFPDN